MILEKLHLCLILILPMMFITNVFAEDTCVPNTVCVSSDDYLKYKIETPFLSTTDVDCCERGFLTYSFGEKTNDKKIKLNIQFETPKNHIYTATAMMNTKTGFIEDFTEVSWNNDIPLKIFPFMLQGISSTSSSFDEIENVKIDKSEVPKSWVEYEGDPREALFIRTVGNLEINIGIEKEKRIVYFSSLNNYQGHYLIHAVLTETNAFNDSQKPLDVNENQILDNFKIVPDWIKNNAGWWADGSIDDQTFVNGIQFLIKENIIQVEKSTEKSDNQAQNIPVWIKNNARWWSEGSITEDDFLKGIQFLASNGIIKVN